MFVNVCPVVEVLSFRAHLNDSTCVFQSFNLCMNKQLIHRSGVLRWDIPSVFQNVKTKLRANHRSGVYNVTLVTSQLFSADFNETNQRDVWYPYFSGPRVWYVWGWIGKDLDTREFRNLGKIGYPRAKTSYQGITRMWLRSLVQHQEDHRHVVHNTPIEAPSSDPMDLYHRILPVLSFLQNFWVRKKSTTSMFLN